MSEPAASWFCNACGGTIYRGVQHICTGSGQWNTKPAAPIAPDWPEITRQLTRIAEALERIADRMPLGMVDRRGM